MRRSKHFGQDALEFGIDGQDQCSKFGWNVGVLIEFLEFGLRHSDANIKLLVLVQKPMVASLFRLSADVSGHFGVIDLIDDAGNLFQSFFDIHGPHRKARKFP